MAGRITLFLGVGNGSGFGSPRPGSIPPVIQVSSSRPEVGSVSPSTLTFPFAEREVQVGGSAQVQFKPSQSGDTTVSFSSGQLYVPDSARISYTVVSPINAPKSVTIPSGFQTHIFVTYLGTIPQGAPSMTVV